MALHYLVDGYNVINKINGFDALKLEDQREQFLKLIEMHCPQGRAANKITIVYDGQPGVTSPYRQSSVKVLFAQGESADDRIKEIVETSILKRNVIVVTDDNDIRFAVRAYGAKIQPCCDFIAKLSAKGKLGKKLGAVKNHQPSKNIPKTLEASITKELKDVWLTDRKK